VNWRRSRRILILPDEPFPFDDGHARYYGSSPARVIDGKLLWWWAAHAGGDDALRAIFREAVNG
jgi:hypothetical protein